jgi:hypothetical protein
MVANLVVTIYLYAWVGAFFFLDYVRPHPFMCSLFLLMFSPEE